ncbi:MAG TPA: DUF4264 family protein [Clostridia bacterium]|jgi:hypothetical protein|nr:DUF4264 family protein [Clostridia bacterium]
MQAKKETLNLLASKKFPYYSEMYQVIDFLNKLLKDQGFILGLVKNKETKELQINIYEI